jgi:hypothetical protein
MFLTLNVFHVYQHVLLVPLEVIVMSVSYLIPLREYYLLVDALSDIMILVNLIV